MESLFYLIQISLQYWYAFLLVLVVVFFRSPRGKGILGEFQINLLNRLFLDKKTYHLLNNVTIPTEQGTTQIDHVIVSRYGIFVVETKNMKGWIFGGEKQKSWTQKLYKHTSTFQNPLRQNYKHTMALAELIGVDPKKIISVIVFAGECSFKTPMPGNVVRGRQYLKFIKAHQTAILGEHDVDELVSRIEERRLAPGPKTHKQHVEHLRDLHTIPKNGRRTFPARAIRIQLLVGLIGIVCGAALVFAFLQPRILKELSGGFTSIINKYSASTYHQDAPVFSANSAENKSKKTLEDREYTFSDVQVKKAMEELLRQKKSGYHADNDAENEAIEPDYQFEIELYSGGKIYTDNAEVSADTVSYSSKNGLTITLHRDEIKSMRKIPRN